MSQKTEEIEIGEKEKEDLLYLGGIFNLSQFRLLSYPEHPTETDALDEVKKDTEDKTYQNIISGLESDLKNIGVEITYTSRIIIAEIAMNLLFIQRVKGSLICKDLLVEKRLFKKSHVSTEKNYDYSHKKTTSTWNFYDYYPSNNESVHPVFDKLIPQLQKQINNGLKSLGLLPSQQAEKRKMIIVQKLRERYEQIDKEYTVRAESEKSVPNKRKPQIQEIKIA